MRFDSVIDLVNAEKGTNENGFSQLIENSRRTIFANKKSIKSSEFYLASQSGFSLEIMFEVFSAEYESEAYLDFGEKRYEIVRVYDKGKLTELICQAYVDKP